MFFGLTIAAAVALSFGVEAIAFPRAPLRRPLAAILLHVAAFAVVAGASIALTGRLFFSISAVVVLIALFAVVSNAKYQSLREPLVFTDLGLFAQVFAYPRLYWPFLGFGKSFAVLAGVLAATAGFLFETPQEMGERYAAGLIALISLPVCLVLSRRLPLALDPISDQRRLGFFAVFVAYLINGMGRKQRHAFIRTVETGPFSRGQPDAQPDVIIIQNESWFDARRLGEFVLSEPYMNFDSIKREAFAYGGLMVPAWGANTMRTEFALLTGLPSAALGYARFYPYLYVRRVCATLAGWFKRGGYRTFAIHPYHANFFGRRRVFRAMDFDHFLDIQDFGKAAYVGPYVGDEAVTDALIELLQERGDKPIFAFAITMENHGPLHLEPVVSGEFKSRHTLGDDIRWRDLTAYLRHVENADKMLGKLTAYLRKRERPTVLCFYGDHVPAMSSVFNALGNEPTRSDYIIWRNFGRERDFGTQQDTCVESLGFALQRAMMCENRNSADIQMRQTAA